MPDRPILFSAPMVRANREGRKTQTRRVIKPQPLKANESHLFGYAPCNDDDLVWPISPHRCVVSNKPTPPLAWRDKHVKYAPGDRLWVRETLRFDWTGVVGGAWRYDEDKTLLHSVAGRTLETPTPRRWPLGFCPSIHMPRWASRLTLIVEGVKVERLQDISREDAIAEGIERAFDGTFRDYRGPHVCGGWLLTPELSFQTLWASIHGPAAWDANPWVTAITYHVVKANIDTVKEAA